MNAPVVFKPSEVALALTQVGSLEQLFVNDRAVTVKQAMTVLGCLPDMIAVSIQTCSITHIHLGNEFCERLLPNSVELKQALALLENQSVELVLVTPMLTDSGIKQLDLLLPKLPANSEVVVNDWGTLHHLRRHYPHLVPMVGRMLNKMIKDPRLPSKQWSQLHPYDSQSKHFQALLGRFDIAQLEMDIPPFASAELFDTGDMGLSVHVPYGYTVKGRMCRIGSLQLSEDTKFQTAHACQKECLNYWANAERPDAQLQDELNSFQRGNTQFYRYSDAMLQLLSDAVGQGLVNRVIVAGDWHENRRPTQQD